MGLVVRLSAMIIAQQAVVVQLMVGQ